jgi:hypothetical protein
MKYNINVDQVEKFWNWFYTNCQNFGDKFENKALLAELDVRVAKLGPFSWEIGPGKVEENAFVISPNGDIQMLEYTKSIIAKARHCHSWEFYYAKPPKKWELKFDYKTAEDKKLHIDASQWKYVLAQYEDGTFEIIIRPFPLLDLNDQDKLSVAEILLDGVLGEEARMKLISYIDVVEQFEEADQRGVSSIGVLSDHLSSLHQ